jgi:hypothetical protein
LQSSVRKVYPTTDNSKSWGRDAGRRILEITHSCVTNSKVSFSSVCVCGVVCVLNTRKFPGTYPHGEIAWNHSFWTPPACSLKNGVSVAQGPARQSTTQRPQTSMRWIGSNWRARCHIQYVANDGVDWWSVRVK